MRKSINCCSRVAVAIICFCIFIDISKLYFSQEFFLNVKDLLRQQQSDNPGSQFQEWTSAAAALQQKFDQTKNSVHEALCDNIDTRTVLEALRELVTGCNIYIRDHSVGDAANGLLLKRIAQYITDMLHIFGAIRGPRGGIGLPLDSSGESDVSADSTKYEYGILTAYNINSRRNRQFYRI